MAKRLLVKLVVVTVMAAGLLVGTPSGASADLCVDIWTMRPKPTRICLWTANL